MGLLLQHGVDEVADVRSSPYSRYASQFNYEALSRMLAGFGEASVLSLKLEV